MRSLILSLFIVVSFTHAQESATQLDLSKPDVETAQAFQAFQACVNEAVADESGYELDESEVEEYCRPSNN